jgi:hypothetical protein
MRCSLRQMMVVALVALGACGPGSPSGEDITQSLEEELRSVSGDWTGLTQGTVPQVLVLNFKLVESANGQLTGTGKMREGSASATVPLTVTGSFQRPVLDLTFDGAVYEGRPVRGTFRGSYSTVGGIISTLELTGDGYTKRLDMLFVESKGSLP